MEDQSSSTDSTIKLLLGPEIERQKTESPLALYIHGLYHSSAVRTRSRRRLSSDNSLLLIAYENQTHLDDRTIFYVSVCLFAKLIWFFVRNLRGKVIFIGRKLCERYFKERGEEEEEEEDSIWNSIGKSFE